MDVETAFLNGELEEEEISWINVYTRRLVGVKLVLRYMWMIFYLLPMTRGDKLHLNQFPSNDIKWEQMKDIPYASAIGSLMYAQVYTRFNIAFAVGMLGKISGAVSWRSAKQTLIATSTMEVEFVSCFEATSHGVWLKSFISGLRIIDLISKPLKIYSDNLAIVFTAKNNKSENRSKHIGIKYLAIRECVKEGKVIIEHISTKLMLAYPWTKGMPPKNFKDPVVRIGIDLMM
ncbi:UNVERIFIED_CONTAM: Retrovirus-related Pol polyprotein from transposon TNT 1-94 [Sesamum angustifolium]|uniref:Retrovirus-related Pol polyprotein from transposon TNT 1-94 n=1 Tax=Sesamum angustifolium TaxID=2727405 RepID=A0AAW2KCM9_9LAMI